MDNAAYLQALLFERAGYVKNGNTASVAEVDAEIERVSGLKVDPDQPDLIVAEPVVDVQLERYLSALVEEREGYVRAGQDDRLPDVDAEIARVEAILGTEPTDDDGLDDLLGAPAGLDELERDDLMAIAEGLGLEIPQGTRTKTIVKLIAEAQSA